MGGELLTMIGTILRSEENLCQLCWVSENGIFGKILEIQQNTGINPLISYLWLHLLERKLKFDCKGVIFFHVSRGYNFVKSLFLIAPSTSEQWKLLPPVYCSPFWSSHLFPWGWVEASSCCAVVLFKVLYCRYNCEPLSCLLSLHLHFFFCLLL